MPAGALLLLFDSLPCRDYPGNSELPLGWSDVPLEGIDDLIPSLLEEQKVALTPSRLVQ